MTTRPPPNQWVAWRRRQSLTQGQLASRLGLVVSSVTHIERGTRRPSVDVLYRLAEELRLDDAERATALRLAATSEPMMGQ